MEFVMSMDGYTITRLEEENDRLLEKIETLERRNVDLSDALQWVLPMAKGYAVEHPVGNNAEIAQSAENVLKPEKGKGNA